MRKNTTKLLKKFGAPNPDKLALEFEKRVSRHKGAEFNGLHRLFEELARVKRNSLAHPSDPTTPNLDASYAIWVEVIITQSAMQAAIETVEDMSAGFPVESSAAVSMVWRTSQEYYRALRVLSDAGLVGQPIRDWQAPVDWVEQQMSKILLQFKSGLLAWSVKRLVDKGDLRADEVERLLGMTCLPTVDRAAA